MDKIRIKNIQKHRVSVNLVPLNGRTLPIMPEGIAYLTVDELAYVNNTSKVFEAGILIVDDKESLPNSIEIPDSPNALSDADMDVLLKKSQRQFASTIEQIDNVNVVRRILEKAKESEKPYKIVEEIEKRIEALLG